ncbi:transposase [Paraburkholderia graminis]|uniref:Transposase n=1 Tax=Paraburkholderia graminis TaxID=60548 RepID=A0ABD5CRD5_9BURK|nr:transposase [Paraburkholderia graminis]
MTGKAKRARYTLEFKLKAVRLVKAGQSMAAVAATLGVVEQTLYTWMKADREGKLTGEGTKRVSPEQMEPGAAACGVARLKMVRDILKNRPTRLGATLMNRNFRGVHLMRAETVAACFLEVSTPSKNLAQGKLRTHLWRRLRATPFRKLIHSESPSCA